MEVYNKSKGTSLGTEIKIAASFWTRLKGLLGKSYLKAGDGLLLTPCQSVHGLGMRFSCEAIYLDAHNRVLHIMILEPGKLGPFMSKARSVVELPLGTVSRSCTEAGDLLVVQEHNPHQVNTI